MRSATFKIRHRISDHTGQVSDRFLKNTFDDYDTAKKTADHMSSYMNLPNRRRDHVFLVMAISSIYTKPE